MICTQSTPKNPQQLYKLPPLLILGMPPYYNTKYVLAPLFVQNEAFNFIISVLCLKNLTIALHSGTGL